MRKVTIMRKNMRAHNRIIQRSLLSSYDVRLIAVQSRITFINEVSLLTYWPSVL